MEIVCNFFGRIFGTESLTMGRSYCLYFFKESSSKKCVRTDKISFKNYTRFLYTVGRSTFEEFYDKSEKRSIFEEHYAKPKKVSLLLDFTLKRSTFEEFYDKPEKKGTL